MKLPKNLFNWISILGILIAANSAIVMLLLFIFSMTFSTSSTYLGLFIYIILPMFLVLGLFLMLLGAIIKIRRNRRKPEAIAAWPHLDLNNKRHRRNLAIISICSLIFIIISSAGSYQAFHYTESVKFCGTLCHSVMNPEYMAYNNSPHAHVACVECHVGEGASWYVKSKMSGLYQVYSVMFNKYHRPIETPIKNLRPARETCEHCHWPAKFYSRKIRSQNGYLADSTNSAWNTTLLMKIGPSVSALGLIEGIHWHINPDVQIEYSSDPSREQITWIKYVNKKTGKTTIYKDTAFVASANNKTVFENRKMDCMDCHNRPSHSYKSPREYVNNGMISGIIPNNLPFIKQISMQILEKEFKTAKEAKKFIGDSINYFYKTNYPDIYSKEEKAIQKAISGICTEFDKNQFPEMKVKYSAYPNHIGHLETDGCFRCHSGRHKSASGKSISKDCNLCHTIIQESVNGEKKAGTLSDALEFMHPVDVGTAWKESLCTECHKKLY